jgi:hypothetical protein
MRVCLNRPARARGAPNRTGHLFMLRAMATNAGEHSRGKITMTRITMTRTAISLAIIATIVAATPTTVRADDPYPLLERWRAEQLSLARQAEIRATATAKTLCDKKGGVRIGMVPEQIYKSCWGTARLGWPKRNRAALSFRQLRRFHHVFNSQGFQYTQSPTMCSNLSSRGDQRPRCRACAAI